MSLFFIFQSMKRSINSIILNDIAATPTYMNSIEPLAVKYSMNVATAPMRNSMLSMVLILFIVFTAFGFLCLGKFCGLRGSR